jgi:nicotinamidase-related amidase
MAPNSVDPNHTAVLSMDLQSGIVSIYAPNDEGFIARAAAVLQRGREAGLTVIHVKVGFRPGLPEVHARNVLLGAVKASPQHQQLFSGAAGSIHPSLGPGDSDIVVTKSRVNSFVGTDLGLVLRAHETDTLILFGIATSGVVLSTALHAADADYRIFIVKDCCVDMDQTVHSCLLEKVLPRCATVLSSDEVLRMLGA